MKKIVSLIILLSLALSCAVLTSCQVPGKDTVTRMTVDINPSIELMVDADNKVISITALNDDAAVLIVGESFVGKTPEQAVELILSLASDTGYLVEGELSADENTVRISVSGDTSYSKKLYEKVSEKADEVMESLDISGKVERVEALSTDKLRELALSTSLYTEEELAEMDDEQLCKVISLGRIETAELLTEELREAYFSAKDYRISFAESEETAKVIETMGGIYAGIHAAYKGALDMYGEAIEELDGFRYEMLVSLESDYQKALAQLRDSKAEFLKQRSYTASLEIGGEEYASATLQLQASEEDYEKALETFERIGNELNTAMDSMLTALRLSHAKLLELETTLFDDKIEQKLQEKATEIENILNEKKDGFFAAFEAEHADDIEAYENALMAKKAELKASIEKDA